MSQDTKSPAGGTHKMVTLWSPTELSPDPSLGHTCTLTLTLVKGRWSPLSAGPSVPAGVWLPLCGLPGCFWGS